MTKEKVDWFNALPFQILDGAIKEYERTCPCGASVRYEYASSMAVESWADIHFGHTQPPKKTYKFEYDFLRPIKFSRVGFHRFSLERELEQVFPHLPKNFQAFKDAKNNVFVFYLNYLDETSLKDAPDLYATFYPSVIEEKG